MSANASVYYERIEGEPAFDLAKETRRWLEAVFHEYQVLRLNHRDPQDLFAIIGGLEAAPEGSDLKRDLQAIKVSLAEHGTVVIDWEY
jgi:hypothetical protein